MKLRELFKVDGYGVLVTGGASGIGLGYVEAMAENGARVTMLDINAQGIDQEIRRLTQAGFDVRGEVVNVTDHEALDSAFDRTAQEYGKLDVVFANAGVDSGPGYYNNWAGPGQSRIPEGALENYTDERWNRVIETNLNGVFATLRAAARHMRPRKSGRIIVTTSLAATICETAIGDAYMVVGGVPLSKKNHAEAIAELALDMVEEVAHFSKEAEIPLDIRIGINTGPAVAGVIGQKKFIYDLWGDTVNTASRMESHGIVGRIQVAEKSYNRLRQNYKFIERGVINIKGKGNMQTYLLDGRK